MVLYSTHFLVAATIGKYPGRAIVYHFTKFRDEFGDTKYFRVLPAKDMSYSRGTFEHYDADDDSVDGSLLTYLSKHNKFESIKQYVYCGDLRRLDVNTPGYDVILISRYLQRDFGSIYQLVEHYKKTYPSEKVNTKITSIAMMFAITSALNKMDIDKFAGNFFDTLLASVFKYPCEYEGFKNIFREVFITDFVFENRVSMFTGKINPRARENGESVFRDSVSIENGIKYIDDKLESILKNKAPGES